jgi:lipoprotein-releasing system ATP-binding protein
MNKVMMRDEMEKKWVTNEVVLACQGLSKTFRDVGSQLEILHEIDLEVKAGELIAIIGNSGSGKSTLLHLLGGLDKPTQGRVLVNNRNLSELSEDEKCRTRNLCLGFIYQFHHLLPEFSALENVSMPLLIRGLLPKEIIPKAEHLLESVGLKDRLHHRPNQLSGGERQRVAIARALVTDPLCILADEPTGDLDPRNAEQVFQIFLKLQTERKTSVIMVTHDLMLAQKAQRRMSLINGRLVDL